MSWGRNELLPKADPDRRERAIAGLLFFATCWSVFGVTAFRWWGGEGALVGALLFTVAFLGPLLAHELAHWSVARGHGFRLSLPWFLPAPFLVGTLGALIRLKSTPPDRTGVVEMGAAGPLAGLLGITLVATAWLAQGPSGGGELQLSRPLLFWLLAAVSTGGPPPAPSATDPLGFAAWLGCLLTAMNLLPIGQLDGGHVFSGLFPRWATSMRRAVAAALLLGAFMWPGWAVWLGAFSLLGAQEAIEVRRPRRALTPRSWVVGAAALLAFVLTFTPVPVTVSAP